MRVCSNSERRRRYGTVLFAFLTLVLVSSPAICAVPNVPEASSGTNPVYVKIILPVKKRAGGAHHLVESWIAHKLRKRGSTEVRAVTPWVRLPEEGEDVAHIWNAVLDGEGWGCPVAGQVVDRTADGKVKVRLSGWSPGLPKIKGETLSSETGSRGIAVVDNGRAYVALLVGPPPAEAESRPAKED